MKKSLIILSVLAFSVSSFINLGIFQREKDLSFEVAPPIAQKTELVKLKQADRSGNNFLFKAFFSQKDKTVEKLDNLTIDLGKEKVTLTDDGKNGDEKAGDKVFSIPMKLTNDELRKMVETQNKLAEKVKFRNVRFENRSEVIEKLEKTDLKSVLELGRPMRINALFTASIFEDPAELVKLKNKSLLINDVSVVEDLTRTYDPCRPNKGNPNGVWSFNKLVANMANTPLTGISTKDFLIDWVDTQLFIQKTSAFSSDVTINKAASKERLIRAWYKRSGGTLAVGIPSDWKTIVKPEDFPVRLLAIVNRLDLRGNMGYGNSNAGEGRFVFCFVDENCQTGNNGPGTMTIILEYGIPISNCLALSDYARKWWILKDLPFGSIYNNQLAIITDVFTKMNANAARPNKSALNHMRTNDFITSPWEIRDFKIDNSSKKFKIISPNKEPKTFSVFNNTQAMIDVVNNIVNINNYSIPTNSEGMSAVMTSPFNRWSSSPLITDSHKEREFSLNTCSSCHTGETKTFFTHIKPRNINSPAVLSSFLTGQGADDSTDTDTDVLGSFVVNHVRGAFPSFSTKHFNETKGRAKDLETLVFDSACSSRPLFPFQAFALAQRLTFKPINMEH